jgi:hypothetical protein
MALFPAMWNWLHKGNAVKKKQGENKNGIYK